MYYDYDDIEYRGISNVRDLFDLSIDEDYYKPIIARGAFDGSYIQYESKGDKGKNLSIKEYLNIIKPCLSNIINGHKTRGLVRYHSGNKAWLEETSSEWKIQLTMAINFILKKPQRISNIKPFIDKYNWKDIDFPSHSIDFHHIVINQLFLIFCVCLIILKK